MSWIRLSVAVSDPEVDAVVNALEDSGAIAVSLEPAAAFEFAGQLPTRVSALFDTSGDQALVAVGVLNEVLSSSKNHVSLAIDGVAERDWLKEFHARFTPIEISARLWICPTWCDPPDPAAVNIRIDPGLAFGTGTHASTRLCLEFLSRHPLRNASVVDYGCGSGILALAAAGLGAEHVWAVDTDTRALDCTRDNATLNRMSSRITVCDPASLHADFVADLVVANILVDTLRTLAPTLIRIVAPGGWLVLAGVLTHQIEALVNAYPGFDFSRYRSDDWVLLAAPHAT